MSCTLHAKGLQFEDLDRKRENHMMVYSEVWKKKTQSPDVFRRIPFQDFDCAPTLAIEAPSATWISPPSSFLCVYCVARLSLILLFYVSDHVCL